MLHCDHQVKYISLGANNRKMIWRNGIGVVYHYGGMPRRNIDFRNVRAEDVSDGDSSGCVEHTPRRDPLVKDRVRYLLTFRWSALTSS